MSKMATALKPIILLVVGLIVAVHGDDSNSYTKEERILLPKVYARVRDDLVQDIMHEDKYLLRFLRAQNHKLDDTVDAIHKFLAWRKENNIDSILNEDWSEWIARRPFTLKIRDREGRPSLASGFANFDLRRFLLKGKAKEMFRYMYYGIELGIQNLHKVSNETGKEFINGHLLFNFAGFNIRKHACLPCIPSWLELLYVYEQYYPQLAKTMICVNTPKIFYNLYGVLKPFMSEFTSNALQVYDFNKANWRNELLKIFEEDKLTLEFGGKAPNSET